MSMIGPVQSRCHESCVLNIGNIHNYTCLHMNTDVIPGQRSRLVVNHDLRPVIRVNAMVAKAHQRANAIHRAFVSRDFLVYVRPLVEYNSIIWSPHLKQDIEAVESVQRRFTRRLPDFKKFSYAERFKRLNLPSLEFRRLHCDLLWCYKIVWSC